MLSLLYVWPIITSSPVCLTIKSKNFTMIECVLFLLYHKGRLEVIVINKPQKPFIHSCKQYIPSVLEQWTNSLKACCLGHWAHISHVITLVDHVMPVTYWYKRNCVKLIHELFHHCCPVICRTMIIGCNLYSFLSHNKNAS